MLQVFKYKHKNVKFPFKHCTLYYSLLLIEIITGNFLFSESLVIDFLKLAVTIRRNSNTSAVVNVLLHIPVFLFWYFMFHLQHLTTTMKIIFLLISKLG